jgi:DNA-binding transcriptional ArsR family regulator
MTAAGTRQIGIITRPAQAAAVMHPVRRKVLESVGNGASAASIARALGLPRQRVNYHVRELEREGLVELVEVRRAGNCVERIVRAAAASWVISPDALGGLSPAGAERAAASGADRFSPVRLIAAASRTIVEVAASCDGAGGACGPRSTVTLEAEVRFASPLDQGAFVHELASAFARIAAKHHAADAARGRVHRFMLLGRAAPTGS